MNYKIINGAISYGAETILEEINFQIKDKEKIAIVGRNGAGKSTLLKAIVDRDTLEEGIGEEKFALYQEGNPQIGYLKQIEFEDDTQTLLQEILKVYEPIVMIEEKMARLEEQLQKETSEEIVAEYAKTRERYEQLEGYTYQKEYRTAIHKFGFTKEDENKRLSEFSGGQRTKIAFIKLLLSKPDILLLDEPTNHLDISTIEWLENYLKNYPKAVVIVSHDRMFLNRIVTKVYEIEYGSITEYAGDYSYFEKEKRIRYEKQRKDFEYQQKEIKRLTQIADRFRYKPTKAKMALSKLKQIERMVKVEAPNPYDLKTFHTNFSLERESGKLVLTIKDLEIGYDQPLAKVSFSLYKGQKLAVIGANGKGKSTLLKTLHQHISPLGGEFEYGYHVKREYFDQQMAFANPNKTVFEAFSECFPSLTTTEIRNSLATFLFQGEDVFKQIKLLSGGEKVRLKLCEMLKKGPNLLLLDEPTNHMDIIGKESLENMLQEYPGTLILVSHDRYFINKIADSFLIFDEESIEYYEGTYEEYQKKKVQERPEQTIKVKKEKIKDNEYLANKEKNKIKISMKKLEKAMTQKEELIRELEEEMLKKEVYTDYKKLNEIQEKVQKLKQEIDEDMEEWVKLEEMI